MSGRLPVSGIRRLMTNILLVVIAVLIVIGLTKFVNVDNWATNMASLTRSHFRITAIDEAQIALDKGQFSYSVINRLQSKMGQQWTAHWLLSQAKLHYAAKQPDVSLVEFLLSVLQEQPFQGSLSVEDGRSVAQLHGWLASWYGIGQLENQLSHWNASLLWWPNFLDGLAGKGITLGRLGKYEEARTWLQRAVELYPEEVAGWSTACIYYRYVDPEWVRAEPFCRVVLSRDSDNIDALSALTVVLLRQQRCQEAVSYSEQWASLDPQNYWAWTNLGDIYWCLGEKEKAKESYRRFVALAPDDIQQQYHTARDHLTESDGK